MIEYLYQALAANLGICAEFEDVARARQRLYVERKKDPAFDILSLVPSPVNPNHLWIVKKGELDAQS